MKVIVLAAGRSKRMKPVRDKNFLSFLGKSLIVRQLELIREAGLNDVILVGGAHNLEALKVEVAGLVSGEDGEKMNIEIVEQVDLEMGMCGAILAARSLISGDESVIVFSSNDVVEGKAFELVLDAAKDDSVESAILGKKVDSYFPGGYLSVDDAGWISEIVEKPEPGTEPSDMVNLVVHLHKNPGKLIETLEAVASEKDDVYEVALGKMMEDGVRMKAVKYDGVWLPIKFPWHVMAVFRWFFEQAEKGISDEAEIAESAIIKGDVIIEGGVRVFENAVISGPAYIGRGSVVANNSLVRDSYVGENCVIGFNTEVARSYLGHDVWTHTNYIGDSVIGNNVSFGSGTVTGNLRLDEKNIEVMHENGKFDTGSNKFGLITGDDIRVGVNTSFMPGIKVGSNSFVGAGIVVAQNIDEKSFVRGSWDLKISENNAEKLKNREDFKNKL